MAQLRNIVALSPSRLLDEAMRGIFPLAHTHDDSPWPTLDTWIVLRQGGLRDDFHARAASQGVRGWFDAPVCVFAELADRWTETSPVALTAEERLVLTGELMFAHGRDVFGRSGSIDHWTPSVDRLIGELVAEAVQPDAFAHVLAANAQRDDFEKRRDQALATIYANWHRRLAQSGKVDGRDKFVRLAKFIEGNPEAFARKLQHRRAVRVAGLADLRGGWTALLRALANTPALDLVTIISSHKLELPPDLACDVEQASEPPSMAAALFTDGTSQHAHDGLRFVEAPDAAREYEVIAVKVRALLNSGAKPTDIAVVTREARPGVDRLHDTLSRMGVPVTARRRLALSHTGPGRVLRVLLRLPTEQWSLHAMTELAEQPLLSTGLDAGVLRFIGSTIRLDTFDAWLAQVEQLQRECEARDKEELLDDYRRRRLPSTRRVATTHQALVEWRERAAFLASEHTLDEWFTWVDSVLLDPEWKLGAQLRMAPAQEEPVLANDLRALEQIAAMSLRWRDAMALASQRGTLVGADQFAARLAMLLSEDLIIQPDTGFGVVVGEALSVAWRSFEHVFLVGMDGKSFPRRRPRSPLFTSDERERLRDAGLPLDGVDEWQSRERELFRVLCASARTSLILSWPVQDNEGREIVPSSYLDEVIDAHGSDPELEVRESDEVLVQGFPVVSARSPADSIAHAHRVAAIEANRSEHQLSPWHGEIEDQSLRSELASRFGEDYVWSVTNLEELATCSWRWFASTVLRLRTRDEAGDSIDPRTRGTVAHRVLERFFATLRAERGMPVFLRKAELPAALPRLRDAFDAVWNEEVATSGHSTLRELERAELLAALENFVTWEAEQNDATYGEMRGHAARRIRMGVDAHEVAFNNVEVESAGVKFRIRGRIDRIDRPIDDRLSNVGHYVTAVDYKSSEASTPAGGRREGWDDGVVLQLPLYATAIRSLQPGAEMAHLSYRILRSPAQVHNLELVQLKRLGKHGVTPEENSKHQERLESALEHAGKKVLVARAGAYLPMPAPSCGCSPFCVARDICRIPGGPKMEPRW